MRILGVDPGLRTTGYGIIDVERDAPVLVEGGIITPNARVPLERRLGELHGELCAVLAAARPDVMVIEELWSGYKNPTTAVLMGHARGVLCLAADVHGVRVRHLGHSHVKRALTGSGAARKEQVKRVVMLHLDLRTVPEPDDVSDALALALALANIERAESNLARAGIA
ncbi:MAG: crossover junction endodeoxyribonuclease RuvC [Candidatus Eremiobacteraeota bacterium]|nr:crossover junction endodeoxyribonuclease RuvC [Candidatus Eremiobacteraeota bacterium]MBC5802600.1 crossover junction endodeoxyribonuclease RuvC [Candidatus Eremiobacteraeota bacterium]MBC5821940.1 crossover junction endodeoxyribonuclease RuvC [Candidatus Eremiobacteraeota bacterium]